MLKNVKLDGHGPYSSIMAHPDSVNVVFVIPDAHIGITALRTLSHLHYEHEGSLQGASVVERQFEKIEGKLHRYRIRIKARLY